MRLVGGFIDKGFVDGEHARFFQTEELEGQRAGLPVHQAFHFPGEVDERLFPVGPDAKARKKTVSHGDPPLGVDCAKSDNKQSRLLFQDKCPARRCSAAKPCVAKALLSLPEMKRTRSEEQKSELQSLMRISYAVFGL